MDASQIMGYVIDGLLVLLAAAAVWAVVEIAVTVRKARTTIANADTAVKNANTVIEKADPLMDHAQLTIDAVNLEIMRVDGILEDVGQVTDQATKTTKSISDVASAPAKLTTSLVEKIRGSLRDGNRERRAARAVEKSIEESEHSRKTVIIEDGTSDKHDAADVSDRTDASVTSAADDIAAAVIDSDAELHEDGTQDNGADVSQGEADGAAR